MNVCSFFGIYPNEIERVSDICSDTLESAGFSNGEIDDVYNEMYEEIYRNPLDSSTTLTNNIIYAMFDVVARVLRDRFNGLDVDYYVNGSDSHLYINHEYADCFDFDEVE